MYFNSVNVWERMGYFCYLLNVVAFSLYFFIFLAFSLLYIERKAWTKTVNISTLCFFKGLFHDVL